MNLKVIITLLSVIILLNCTNNIIVNSAVDQRLIGTWKQVGPQTLFTDTMSIYNDSLIHTVGVSLFSFEASGEFYAEHGYIGVGDYSINKYDFSGDTLNLYQIDNDGYALKTTRTPYLMIYSEPLDVTNL